MRDSQRSRVYDWENITFSTLWKAANLTPDAARSLYMRILRDAGRDPNLFSIKFTKRRGGACASYREANFTPSRLPPIIVIHEAAHTLTRSALVPDAIRCAEGHGPRYVACYLALLQRYLGVDLKDALISLRQPVVKVVREWVPQPTGAMIDRRIARPDGSFFAFQTPEMKNVIREKTLRKAPPVYDINALQWWRAKLGSAV